MRNAARETGMSRRSRYRAPAPPVVDPRIEPLAQALIAALDAQGIPLADVGRLWPDIAERIEQEARDREARRLAEIDERRRIWAEEQGLVDTPALAARLGLDERELATAERLGFVAQREWPVELRKPIEYGPRFWSGLYDLATILTDAQRREIAETVLLSREEAAERLGVSAAQFDHLRKQAGLNPNIAGRYRLCDVDALRDQAATLSPPAPSGKRQPIDAWNALNERQQIYLRAIYEIDQAQEQQERGSFVRGERSRPAAEWRQIEYGLLPGFPPFPSALFEAIEQAGLRDEGTGSTFNALEARKLIVCHYPGRETPLSVVITALGRRVARAGMGELPALRPSKELLHDWAWKHLAGLYVAEPHGIVAERFGSRTLEYLENRGLVEQRDLVVRLSDQGRRHYETNWSVYRELYPQIEAPRPAALKGMPAERE
jgi:hypothetical protein